MSGIFVYPTKSCICYSYVLIPKKPKFKMGLYRALRWRFVLHIVYHSKSRSVADLQKILPYTWLLICIKTLWQAPKLSGLKLNMREKFRYRILKRDFLRRNRDEVTNDWRKIHIDELRNIYSSSDNGKMIKSRKLRCFRSIVTCSTSGINENYIRNFSVKISKKIQLWILYFRWEYTCKIESR